MLNRRSSLVTSLASCALGAALLVPTAALAAPNWSLPGISLQDLVDGGSFQSDDGSLSFTDFSATVSGVRLRSLDLYRVLPGEQGFEIFAPLLAGPGDTATLDLAYTVSAAPNLEIDSAAVSFLGFALGSGGSSGVEIALFDSGGAQQGSLLASREGFFGPGDRDDATGLDPSQASLRVQESVHATAGQPLNHVGFAATLTVGHHYTTTAVPEPGTALLLGLGMGGLAIAGRRRRAVGHESGPRVTFFSNCTSLGGNLPFRTTEKPARTRAGSPVGSVIRPAGNRPMGLSNPADAVREAVLHGNACGVAEATGRWRGSV